MASVKYLVGAIVFSISISVSTHCALAALAEPTHPGVRHVSLHLNCSNVFVSPLPAFFHLEGASEGQLPRAWGWPAPGPEPWEPSIGDSCSDDIFVTPQESMRDHILPHLLQNRWDAAEEPTLVPTVELASEHIRVQIIPQWGAKVHSITDLATGAPLVLENPTHNPFNGAVRKPFSSGGIEWNWGGGRGQIGHSVFSEQPAFVAHVRDPAGAHVRLYEYDRFNKTLWQVDVLLPNGTHHQRSRAAWIHVRVTNPLDHPTKGYWWTNTAVRSTRHCSKGDYILHSNSHAYAIVTTAM